MSEDSIFFGEDSFVLPSSTHVIHIGIRRCQPFQVVDLTDALLTNERFREALCVGHSRCVVIRLVRDDVVSDAIQVISRGNRRRFGRPRISRLCILLILGTLHHSVEQILKWSLVGRWL